MLHAEKSNVNKITIKKDFFDMVSPFMNELDGILSVNSYTIKVVNYGLVSLSNTKVTRFMEENIG